MSKIDDLITAKTRLDFLNLTLKKINSFDEYLKNKSISNINTTGLCLTFNYYGNTSWWIDDLGDLKYLHKNTDKNDSIKLELDKIQIPDLRNKLLAVIKDEILIEIKQLEEQLAEYL